MGLTMSQRQAVTTTIEARDKRTDRVEKGQSSTSCTPLRAGIATMLARRSGRGCGAKVVRPRRPRVPTYGVHVVVGPRFCWAVLGAPTGKRLGGGDGRAGRDAAALR